jgi:hypothetical protein
MTHPGLLIGSHSIQTGITPWYTELELTVSGLKCQNEHIKINYNANVNVTFQEI